MGDTLTTHTLLLHFFSNEGVELKTFEYFEPKTVREAVKLLSRYGDRARILAGGTDLLVQIKDGAVKPDILVSISKIRALNGFKQNGEVVRLGAGTRLVTLLNVPVIKERFLPLYEAVSRMGTPQVRNMATIGGNICRASPAADLAPPLLAYDAKLLIAGKEGERVLPIAEFFKGPNLTALKSDEILTVIHLPQSEGKYGCFIKIGRTAVDLAKINVCTVVEMKDCVCEDARIALGAVASTPIRAVTAERILVGKKLTSGLLEEASRAAADETRPISDVRSTATYRKNLCKVLVRRALEESLRRARGSSK